MAASMKTKLATGSVPSGYYTLDIKGEILVAMLRHQSVFCTYYLKNIIDAIENWSHCVVQFEFKMKPWEMKLKLESFFLSIISARCRHPWKTRLVNTSVPTRLIEFLHFTSYIKRIIARQSWWDTGVKKPVFHGSCHLVFFTSYIKRILKAYII